MPIPIYQALTIEESALLGGSTLPSIMTVQNAEHQLVGKYVVKVFKQRNIEQYQPTNKEVYCHVLASEFDLHVPNGALIYVNSFLINELKTHERYKELELKEGYYFGTEYLANASPFQVNLSEKFIDDITVENIFAFDVLIRNMDRNIQKPNFIFWNGNPILIDHDIALNIEKGFEEYLELNLWNILKSDTSKRHIFMDRLQQSKQKGLWTFEEFLEYLRSLNFNKLYACRDLLDEHGQKTIDFDAIIEYFKAIKQNPALFQNLLFSLIQ